MELAQTSQIDNDRFELNAFCKSISFDTFAPYVSVRLNDFELIQTAVSPGYDTLQDCMSSSVKAVVVDERRRRVDGALRNLPTPVHHDEGRVRDRAGQNLVFNERSKPIGGW